MAVKIEGIDKTMAYIQRQAQKKVKEYLELLQRVGLEVVGAIRTGKASYWVDDTHNLRASIGFIIVHDGQIVDSNFQLHDGKGQEGVEKGRTYAEELAAKYPKGYILIIVAGMEYAAYVEAVESRTVLAGGKLLAEKLHKELCAKLAAKWDSKTS